jgi:hypothetical protein
MIQSGQPARHPSFSRGFSGVWTPTRADVIKIAGEPTWNGRSVKMVFGSVRKLVECDSARQGEIGEGDEVTYSEIRIKGRDRLDELIQGEQVEIHVDWRPDAKTAQESGYRVS